MVKSNKQIKEEYANMIRKWRLKRKIGLRDFAEIIEVSPKILCHLEMGMTKEELAARIRWLLN